jgi:hypothetical protein
VSAALSPRMPREAISSIYMYKNDVGVMYSHNNLFLFFLLHKLHDHIHSPFTDIVFVHI